MVFHLLERALGTNGDPKGNMLENKDKTYYVSPLLFLQDNNKNNNNNKFSLHNTLTPHHILSHSPEILGTINRSSKDSPKRRLRTFHGS
jgi:hypothetical protein